MDGRTNGRFSFIPFISFFYIIFHWTRFYSLDFVPNMYKICVVCCICVSEYAVICKMLDDGQRNISCDCTWTRHAYTGVCAQFFPPANISVCADGFCVLCTLHSHLKCKHKSKGTLINYSNHPLNLRANTFKFGCCYAFNSSLVLLLFQVLFSIIVYVTFSMEKPSLKSCLKHFFSTLIRLCAYS